MSQNRCSHCEEEFGDKAKLIACDSCHDTFHAKEACVELSATEFRAVIVQNRSLVFFCSACRLAFKNVPILLRRMDELKQEVQVMKDKMERFNTEKNNLEDKVNEIIQSEIKMDMEEILNEIEERRKRANNIIICNINESPEQNVRDRIEEEKKTIKSLLSNVLSEPVDFRVIRLGKYDGQRNRPVKVILNSREYVLNILKNKQKILQKVPSLIIYADQTIRQRDYLKNLKVKLNNLVSAGDISKTIKYINGIPKIVDKSHSKN